MDLKLDFITLFLLYKQVLLACSQDSEVICSPAEKQINVIQGSTIVLKCSILVDRGTRPSFTWVISNKDFIETMEPGEEINSVGAFDNYTTIANITCKNATPTFLTEVDVDVSVRIKENITSEQHFLLIFGSNTNLILIAIGSIFGTLFFVSIIAGSIFYIVRKKRNARPGDGIGGNHSSQNTSDDGWHDVDLCADDIQTEQAFQHQLQSQDNNGFDYESVIDNLTSVANENFSERPISKYISQISTDPVTADPEFVDADLLPSMGRARVALGGGADLGAGQVHVRDHEELEVIQKDLGSGYTAIRKISTGEYGFLPTSSLIFND